MTATIALRALVLSFALASQAQAAVVSVARPVVVARPAVVAHPAAARPAPGAAHSEVVARPMPAPVILVPHSAPPCDPDKAPRGCRQ